VDLQEALAILREKIKSPTFRKAVGARTAEAIETLVKLADCGACLDEAEAARLVANYYVFESRVKRLLDLYDRVTRGALRAVAAEILGEEFTAHPLDYTTLIRELEAYRQHLFSIAQRATKCTTQRH
jgi:hypothetical protein